MRNFLTSKKIGILLFLSLGTLLAIVLSYLGWQDVYRQLHYPERVFMYETSLLVIYSDFTLLSILGSISIVSFLRNRKLWIHIIKCIIVNVVLWMTLALVISVIVLVYDLLLGIILVAVFGLFVWGLVKLWKITNALRLIAENEAIENREPFGWKRFLNTTLGIIIVLGLFITLITRPVQNRNRGDVFKCVDTRLGIENTDYRVLRQSYHIHGFQDPSKVQKIKLNARGREIVSQYVLCYQTNLSGIGQASEYISKAYKPKIDYRTAHLDNSLDDSYRLENYCEILEDSEDSYVRMQTSQVGRYFEQFCWLGGDYWKIIIDRKRGIIYREYGSI